MPHARSRSGRSLATLVLITALAISLASAVSSGDSGTDDISGVVRDPAGRPLRSVLVTATRSTSGIRVSVYTDSEGRYTIPLEPGEYLLRIGAPGFEAAAIDPVSVGPATSEPVDVRLSPRADAWTDAPSNLLLALLPDGETKRRFILDCTGCHQFDQVTIAAGDGTKTREAWNESIGLMLSFAGDATPFPIMSASREAGPTSEWLVAGLEGVRSSDRLSRLVARAALPPLDASPAPDRDIGGGGQADGGHAGSAREGGPRITEYDFPVAVDLPHDIAVSGDRVIVTGMFTHAMYSLDPESGQWTTVEIPVAQANPRALEVDESGNWYVLLGAPQRLAHYDPATGDWTSWELGMYPHSIMRDAGGRVWFNGHFSRDPELIGSLDPTTGAVETYMVPVGPMPDGGRTIQYGLRVAPDGSVWTTQLAGGRLIRYHPVSGEWRVYDLPTPFSGPRRPDVDSAGRVWIPEYAHNRLARFDPATEAFTEYELPIPDALPYVVRVDRARNRVWIGTAAADALLLFEPASERFTVFLLPTRGALVRHLDIDERSGDVWAAYGAAPSRVPARVARLQID